MNLNFVLPLTKVADGEQRLVYGRAAACVPDRSGEVMDWETGKSAIKEWSDSFSKITNGQSFGNVRLMHDSKRVVGTLVEMSFDDAAQAVDVVAHVVEDEAWKLVKAGCITGFSIGGSYSRKWADTGTGLTKYTPRLAEISLVDRPCIPDATIAMVKSDGTVSELRITGRTEFGHGRHDGAPPRTFAELTKAAPRSFNQITEEEMAKRFIGRRKVAGIGRMLGQGLGRQIVNVYNRGADAAARSGARTFGRAKIRMTSKGKQFDDVTSASAMGEKFGRGAYHTAAAGGVAAGAYGLSRVNRKEKSDQGDLAKGFVSRIGRRVGAAIGAEVASHTPGLTRAAKKSAIMGLRRERQRSAMIAGLRSRPANPPGEAIGRAERFERKYNAGKQRRDALAARGADIGARASRYIAGGAVGAAGGYALGRSYQKD
jgi:hypothetical protein